MTFSYRITDNTMDIKLTAPTKGWVSVGFNPEFKMRGADYIIGAVVDGKVIVEDHYGTGPFSMKNDIDLGGEFNVYNINGKEEDNTTTIEFSISLDSGDKYDSVISKGKTKVLLAYAKTDNFKKKHNKRSTIEVDFK